MALIWCLEHGVFPLDKAKKVAKIVEQLKRKEKAGGAVSLTKSKSSKRRKTSSNVVYDAVGDAGMGAQMATGIGTSITNL